MKVLGGTEVAGRATRVPSAAGLVSSVSKQMTANFKRKQVDVGKILGYSSDCICICAKECIPEKISL